MGQDHIQPKARHLQDQALRHRQGFLVGGGIGPGDHQLLAAQVAALLFDYGHQIRQDLEGVVDVVLHVEHRDARVAGHLLEILVAGAPVAVADGDAVVVAPVDLPDLFGRVPVRDLGGLGVDKGGVPAQVGHAHLKRGAGAGGGEEKQEGQGFVAQVGMRLPQRPLAFQVKGHLQHRLDFLLAEIQIADQIPSM